jgi:hypothetical protein
VAVKKGDYTAARALYEKSLAIRQEIGDKKGIASCLAGLGEIAAGNAMRRGDAQLETGQKPGQRTRRAAGAGRQERRETEGEAHTTLAELGRAARLFGAVAAMLDVIGATLDIERTGPYERTLEATREVLGSTAFEEAWEQGRAMGMEAAVGYAFERNPR